MAKKSVIIVSAVILLGVGYWTLSPIFITREVSESLEDISGAVVHTEESGAGDAVPFGKAVFNVSSPEITHEEPKKDTLKTFHSENSLLNFIFEYPASLSPIEYPIPVDADWNITENPSYTAVFFEKNFSINIMKGFFSVEAYLDWTPNRHRDDHYENIIERTSTTIAGQPGIKETVYIMSQGVKTLYFLGYYVYHDNRIYEFLPDFTNPSSIEYLEIALKSFKFLN